MPLPPLDLHPNNFRSLLMFVLALANYALMYIANILLARSLTVDDFDDYSVALSIVTMLSTLATLGLEKYALRAVALFRDRQDWPKFRGFWLFSLRTISGFSLILVALLGFVLEAILAIHHADYHIAIVIYACFLPIKAMTLFLVEVIAAHGAQILSMTIYRLFLPLVYVLLIIGLSFSSLPLTALTAVLCFGSAWVLTFTVIWFVTKMLMPVEVNKSIPTEARKKMAEPFFAAGFEQFDAYRNDQQRGCHSGTAFSFRYGSGDLCYCRTNRRVYFTDRHVN